MMALVLDFGGGEKSPSADLNRELGRRRRHESDLRVAKAQRLHDGGNRVVIFSGVFA
jgi:hypothetical protein